MRKSLFLFLAGFFYAGFATAQTLSETTAAKPVMEQEGKIYVVLLVCLVVLGGLITYLFMLDKRISRMEKEKK
jgi:hypothetical protein